MLYSVCSPIEYNWPVLRMWVTLNDICGKLVVVDASTCPGPSPVSLELIVAVVLKPISFQYQSQSSVTQLVL